MAEREEKEMKFDESKVINALHTDKAEIGKKYWFSDNISILKERVENSFSVYKLRRIQVTERCPFCISEEDTSSSYALIYPYEEPTKKLVPFTWEDFNEIYGRKIYKKDCSKECEIRSIISIRKDSSGKIYFGDISAEELLENWAFGIGEPCGKEVEE